MPAYLYDANGYLALGPPLPVWARVRLLLEGPAAAAFMADGVTDNPRQLARELSEVESEDAEVRTALRLVLRAAAKAEQVLVLTDGAGVAAQ